MGNLTPEWEMDPTSSAQESSSPTPGFLYVYLLQSLVEPESFYTGLTRQLAARLDCHNRGAVSSTVRHRPWQIRVAVAFRDPALATRFERYLKSGSGRAFAKRHF